MDKSFLKWLNAELIIESFTHRSGSGVPQYAPPITLKAYESGERRVVRNQQGDEVVSDKTFYLNGTAEAAAIKYNDRITLPDTSQPPILALAPFFNEKGQLELLELSI